MSHRFFLVRSLLVLLVFLVAAGRSAAADEERIRHILDEASAIQGLETVLVSIDGREVATHGYGGHGPDRPTNIKSASKVVLSALVGIAIDKGLLDGPDQPIAPLLSSRLPAHADPRLSRVTVGNLLSMQAGLRPTSGSGYGAWVKSRDWVRAALSQPFDGEPGGKMLYSTGNSHVLSAILTAVTGRKAEDVARAWLRPVKGFSIANWAKDPQGINIGGNQMAMTPRSLLAFGELYRRDGLAPDGERVLPGGWVEKSWRPRTASIHSGDGYGYGWYLKSVAGHDVHYAWGYGGQMLYIVPALGLTVVMTSDETRPSAGNGHRARLDALLARIVEASERPEFPAGIAPDTGTASHGADEVPDAAPARGPTGQPGFLPRL